MKYWIVGVFIAVLGMAGYAYVESTAPEPHLKIIKDGDVTVGVFSDEWEIRHAQKLDSLKQAAILKNAIPPPSDSDRD